MHLFRLFLSAVSIGLVLGRRPVAPTANEGDDEVVAADQLAESLAPIGFALFAGGTMIGTIGTWAVLRRDILQGKPMTNSQVKLIYSALLERANGKDWLRECIAFKVSGCGHIMSRSNDTATRPSLTCSSCGLQLQSRPVDTSLEYARRYIRYFAKCEEEMAAHIAQVMEEDERRESGDEEDGNRSFKFQEVDVGGLFQRTGQAMKQYLFRPLRRVGSGGAAPVPGLLRPRVMP